MESDGSLYTKFLFIFQQNLDPTYYLLKFFLLFSFSIETFHQLPTYLEALASMLKYLNGVK